MNHTSQSSLVRCLFPLLVLGVGLAPVIGCGGGSTAPEAESETHAEGDDHAHDDAHEHGDHGDDHAHDDHPAHGPHGGHMLALSGGDAEVEVAFQGDDQVIVHFPAEVADSVQSVEMRYQVEGQDPMVFELTADESLGEHAYQATSPELRTAIEVGEAAGVQLVVTTDEGEWTGAVRHFDH